MRRAAKRDIAEPPIVEALEAIGAEVTRISSPNAPDLIVKYRGVWTPLGVKTLRVGRKQAQLTKHEQKGVPWPLVKTPQEAYDAIGFVGLR